MSASDSLFVALTALGIAAVALIGIVREGYAQAQSASGLNNTQFANSTAGQLEAFSGVFVELLPFLMLAVGAAIALEVLR
jgi:hypothetical protein